MEFLLICFAVLTVALAAGYGIRQRREEWRHDNWGECYRCCRVGYVAGWRALNAFGSKFAPRYIAVRACAQCKQWRELAAEKGEMRKMPFYDSRSAALDLAEQMNDDVRNCGRRLTEY